MRRQPPTPPPSLPLPRSQKGDACTTSSDSVSGTTMSLPRRKQRSATFPFKLVTPPQCVNAIDSPNSGRPAPSPHSHNPTSRCVAQMWSAPPDRFQYGQTVVTYRCARWKIWSVPQQPVMSRMGTKKKSASSARPVRCGLSSRACSSAAGIAYVPTLLRQEA